MTKLTTEITIEELQYRINAHENDLTQMWTADYFLNVQKELLALKQAAKNPIAWVATDSEGFPEYNGHNEFSAGCGAGTPLYAAPVLPKQPEHSRQHFESLCNQFWNWAELDEIDQDEEPRLEWNGSNYTHRVTAALWKMYQAAHAQPVIPEQRQMVPDEIMPDQDNTYDYVDGWNACRAEMLKAQQNEPQNIPESIPAPLDAQDLELYVDMLENSDSDDEDGELNNTQLIVWLKELQRRRALSAQPVSEIRARAISLYKPPFKFDFGYIWDADGQMVADQNLNEDGQILRVRGWGRISYLENPEALQDEVGEVIALALSNYWNLHIAADLIQPVSEPYKLAKSPEACAWISDGEGLWLGDCGVTWQFFDDGPNENGLKYCPSCGKKVSFIASPTQESEQHG